MIFKSEMHRPSSAKLWQMPHPTALPIAPLLCEREVPLEAGYVIFCRLGQDFQFLEHFLVHNFTDMFRTKIMISWEKASIYNFLIIFFEKNSQSL